MVAKERGRPRTLTMVAFLVPEEEEVLYPPLTYLRPLSVQSFSVDSEAPSRGQVYYVCVSEREREREMHIGQHSLVKVFWTKILYFVLGKFLNIEPIFPVKFLNI